MCERAVAGTEQGGAGQGSGIRGHEKGQIVVDTAVGGAVGQDSSRLLPSVTLAHRKNATARGTWGV